MEGSNELLSKKLGWVIGWTRWSGYHFDCLDYKCTCGAKKKRNIVPECVAGEVGFQSAEYKNREKHKDSRRQYRGVKFFCRLLGFFSLFFPLGNCLFLDHCLCVPAYTPGMVKAKDGRAERDGGDEEDVVDIDHLDIQV